MNGLAYVDGFKIFIQVCVWPRFQPLKLSFNLISRVFTFNFSTDLDSFDATKIVDLSNLDLEKPRRFFQKKTDWGQYYLLPICDPF